MQLRGMPSVNHDQLWGELNDIAHPSERPLPDELRSYYVALYVLMNRLQPTTVCEIGVRAGYSSYTIMRACPKATILGIEANGDESNTDTSGGKLDFYKHALETLKAYPFRLMLANSHDIQRLPFFDMIYVDGDHTYDGCLQDLRLARDACR